MEDTVRPIVNPFYNAPKLSPMHILKIVMMSILVVPFRLLFIGLTLGVAYIIASAALFSYKELPVKPLRGWRRKAKDLVAKLMVVAHVFAGFHRIKWRGVAAPVAEAPILVMAPHISFFDTLPFCAIGAPSVVGKKEVMETFCIGQLLRLVSPILVDRECKDSRKATIEMIQQRAEKLSEDPHSYSQIAIFPEGTCTNRTSLLTFKPGAFLPGLPVQPVLFKWHCDPDFYSWTWDGTGGIFLFWWALCNLQNHLEIEYLPVYYPNDEEKADARLFARNVREVMAKGLNLPTCEYALEDALYLTSWYRPKLHNLETVCAKAKLPHTERDIHHLKTTLAAVMKKLEVSCMEVDRVDFESFCDLFGVDPTDDLMRRVFNMFDWNVRGFIDVREFILAHHCQLDLLNNFHFYFNIFSSDMRGICEEDFIKLFRFPCHQSVGHLREKFQQLDPDKQGVLDFESVRRFHSALVLTHHNHQMPKSKKH